MQTLLAPTLCAFAPLPLPRLAVQPAAALAVRAAAVAMAAPPPATSEKKEEEELSIRELLSRYGVIALLFHFSVWITCLTSVFALLSFGLDIDGLLPDWLLGTDADGATEAAGAAGRIAATLAVVEGIGPARMALTVAATPKVSEKARQYQLVRDIEAFAEDAWARVTGGEKA